MLNQMPRKTRKSRKDTIVLDDVAPASKADTPTDVSVDLRTQIRNELILEFQQKQVLFEKKMRDEYQKKISKRRLRCRGLV